MAAIKNVSFTTSFKPTSIGGCALWLDAADSVTVVLSNASNVTRWRDKSGSNNTAVAGTATYPIYSPNSLNSLPVIQLRAANDYFIVANNFTYSAFPSLTYFIVMKPFGTQQSISALGVLSTDTPNLYGRSLMLNGATGNYRQERYSAFSDIAPYSSTRWDVLSMQFNTTVSSSFTLNGVLYTLTATGVGTNTASFQIGSATEAPYTTFNTNLDIGEILVYGASLSTGQRQQVEGYLAWKWGLQSNLPANHPYVNSNWSLIFPSIPYSVTYPYSVGNNSNLIRGALVPGLNNIVRPLGRIAARTTFDPLTIPGCFIWFDGADTSTFSLSGNLINQWRDKSGNNNHLNSNASFQKPLLTSGGPFTRAYPTFYRNSASSYSCLENTTCSFNSRGFSLFLVPQVTNTSTTFQRLFSCGTGASDLLATSFNVNTAANNATIAVERNSGTPVSYLTTATTTVINRTGIVEVILNGGSTTVGGIPSSNYFMFINGVYVANTVGISTPCNVNFSFFRLGAKTSSSPGNDGNVETFQGNMYEVLMFSNVLTVTQRQKVEAYLATKWGIKNLLSSSNPYKTVPIT